MKIHDKYVIELKEVIRGYGNYPISNSPLPCDYKFYEIDGVAICEESVKKMTPLQTEIIKVLEDIKAEIENYNVRANFKGTSEAFQLGVTRGLDLSAEIIDRKVNEVKNE